MQKLRKKCTLRRIRIRIWNKDIIISTTSIKPRFYELVCNIQCKYGEFLSVYIYKGTKIMIVDSIIIVILYRISFKIYSYLYYYNRNL